MKLSSSGRSLLKRLEGSRRTIYRDSGGKATIGVGHLVQPGEYFPSALTDQQIEDLLTQDLVRFESAVNSTIKARISQDQFDALVIYAFNIGDAAFKKSTLAQLINSHAAENAIRDWWTTHWITVDGVYSRGLYNRRVVEADLFLGARIPLPAVAMAVLVLFVFIAIWKFMY